MRRSPTLPGGPGIHFGALLHHAGSGTPSTPSTGSLFRDAPHHQREKGETVFEQRGVEVPKTWSQTATNVVVSKYFRGQLDSPQRERSVRPAHRAACADTIAAWGRAGGYFATEADGATFRAELTHILLNQHACFNSPVWFNVGIEEKPQCSACFINAVEDTMQSILTLAKTEGMLFKYGSGTGSNLSRLRSSRELLAGGGTASGPVSFMKGFDAFAGVIKSGGKTRRAAKMVILDVDHPRHRGLHPAAKAGRGAQEAWALIEAGFAGGFNVLGGAYDSIAYQKACQLHSVRCSATTSCAPCWPTANGPRPRAPPAPPWGLTRRAISCVLSRSPPGCVAIPACSTTPRSTNGTPAPPRGASTPATLAASTCSLTIRRATWRRSNLMRFYEAESGFDVASFRHVCEVVISACRRSWWTPPRQLSGRRASTSTRTSSRPLGTSAMPTWVPCSWLAACPTIRRSAVTTPPPSPP